MQTYNNMMPAQYSYDTTQEYNNRGEGMLMSPVHLQLRETHIKDMPIKYLNTVLKMQNFDRNQIKTIKQQRRKMKIKDYAEINKIRTVLSDRKINHELKHLNEKKQELLIKKESLEAEITKYKEMLSLN